MDLQILSEYFKKFFAVDGLWFMMLEKTDSFDKALEVNGMVWKILPINIIIKKCPWLTLLKQSNREHLAERISDVICSVEYGAFAGEFMEKYGF